MVVTGITAGLNTTFTPHTGYTEGIDFTSMTAATETSYKVITNGATENPATFTSTLNRHCTLGFQVRY